MRNTDYKKILMSLGCLLLSSVLLFTGCNSGGGGETTTEDAAGTTDSRIAVTDDNGDAVTTIITDEEGNTKVYNIYKDASDGSGGVQHTYEVTDSASAPGGNQTSTTLSGEVVPTNDTPDDPQAQAITNIIKILNSGNYRFVGTVPGGEGEDPAHTEMTVFGSNLVVAMELDGIKLGVRIIDGVMYWLNPSTKKYCEVSGTSMKMMGMDGDSLNFDNLTSSLGEEFRASGDPTISTTTIDGKSVTKYDYPKTDGGRKIFYIDASGKLLRMENVAASTGELFQYNFSTFEGGITMDDINIPGDYSKQLFATFIVGLASSFGITE